MPQIPHELRDMGRSPSRSTLDQTDLVLPTSDPFGHCGLNSRIFALSGPSVRSRSGGQFHFRKVAPNHFFRERFSLLSDYMFGYYKFGTGSFFTHISVFYYVTWCMWNIWVYYGWRDINSENSPSETRASETALFDGVTSWRIWK